MKLSRLHRARVRRCVGAFIGAVMMALYAGRSAAAQPPRPQRTETRATQPQVRAHVAATALFTVSNAWAFPALKGGTGGAYFTLQNNTHHTARIVGASSPISAAAELHETMQTHAMSHMQMQRFVEIAPGQRIVFAPGGLHVMLARLNTAMVPNDTVRVVLDVTMVPAAHTTKNAITRVPISVVVRRP